MCHIRQLMDGIRSDGCSVPSWAYVDDVGVRVFMLVHFPNFFERASKVGHRLKNSPNALNVARSKGSPCKL